MAKVVIRATSDGRKFADHIEVTRKGVDFSLRIDGEEFPWAILDTGITFEVSERTPSAITISIPTSRLSVTDEW